MTFIFDIFKYTFLQRAFIAGIFISVCVALLGVGLVFKRYAMIGDGLSHVGFSAFAVSSVLNFVPIFICLPVVVIVAVFLLLLNGNSKIKGDSGVALISNSSMSIGIIAISVSTGMNTDVLGYMFGSILTLNSLDLFFSVFFSTLFIISFIFLYNKIFAIIFDEDFAKATGVKVTLYNIFIAVSTATIIVVGMKMVGALLISSLIIFPVLSASRVFNRYKTIVIFSAVNSVFCFVIGFLMSCCFSLPTGATVVVVNFLLFISYYVFSLFKKAKKTN